MFGRSKAEDATRRLIEMEIETLKARIELDMSWAKAQYEIVRKTTIYVPVTTTTHTYTHVIDLPEGARRVVPEMSRFDLWHPSIFPTDGYMCDADMCLLPEQRSGA